MLLAVSGALSARTVPHNLLTRGGEEHPTCLLREPIVLVAQSRWRNDTQIIVYDKHFSRNGGGDHAASQGMCRHEVWVFSTFIILSLSDPPWQWAWYVRVDDLQRSYGVGPPPFAIIDESTD